MRVNSSASFQKPRAGSLTPGKRRNGNEKKIIRSAISTSVSEAVLAGRGNFGKNCPTNRANVIGFKSLTREHVHAKTTTEEYDDGAGAI